MFGRRKLEMSRVPVACPAKTAATTATSQMAIVCQRCVMHQRARRTMIDGVDGCSVVMRGTAPAHWGCAEGGVRDELHVGGGQRTGRREHDHKKYGFHLSAPVPIRS